MQNLKIVPETVQASFQRAKRTGIAFAPRFYMLLVIGLIFLAPAFLDHQFLWALLVWDLIVVALWGLDLFLLPDPREYVARREWPHAAMLSTSGEVTLTITSDTDRPVSIEITEDIPLELGEEPVQIRGKLPDVGETIFRYTVRPTHRGDCKFGLTFMRYQSAWQLAERWAKADLQQTIRVYPSTADVADQSIYLMRSRRLDMEKRLLRRRGLGREFESLREYREGDNYRDVSWTATARRGKLVVREYQVERSQPVWLVVDCGRLMRARVGELSKLDYAVSAALSLAQVAIFGGDKVGLLAYGLNQRRTVPLGRSPVHLRNILEQLAAAREESAEANHLLAAGSLLTMQTRRSLVVWITDLADTAMTPEVVEGASVLLSRHLVLFAVLEDPQLKLLANSQPEDPDQLYRITAAQEIVHRREVMIAKLRAQGAHTLEVGAKGLSGAVVEQYFALKERNLI